MGPHAVSQDGQEMRDYRSVCVSWIIQSIQCQSACHEEMKDEYWERQRARHVPWVTTEWLLTAWAMLIQT